MKTLCMLLDADRSLNNMTNKIKGFPIGNQKSKKTFLHLNIAMTLNRFAVSHFLRYTEEAATVACVTINSHFTNLFQGNIILVTLIYL